MAVPEPRPVYLHAGPQPMFAWLHAPAEATPEIGVVIVSPFGWEEMSSYRPRIVWATHLAARGIPTLRFDLPSTGDSAGAPSDPDRLATWTTAVAAAAAWLRDETGVTRVVAAGIGLGGILAVRAIAVGAPIDDLVLWSVPSRGKSLLREMRAFARMEAAQRAEAGDVEQPDGLPDGYMTAGGYVLSDETRAAIEAIDLTELELGDASGRRVLLLERDGIRVDAKLREHLEAAGVEITVANGRGYAAMMVEPQFARVPTETLDRVAEWVAAIEAVPGPGVQSTVAVPTTSDEIEIEAGTTTLREAPMRIPDAAGDAFAVVTTPVSVAPVGVTAVLLGGTGHRIGPNRMWVEIARRWAASGVVTARVDLVGAGDAAGDPPPSVASLHERLFIDQIHRALDHLAEQGLPDQFICLGLCAGAYWALHVALEHDRFVSPLMLNLRVFRWDEDFHAKRMTTHYRRMLFRRSTWQRLWRGQVSLRNLPRVGWRRATTWLRTRAGERSRAQLVDRMLDTLEAAQRPSLMLFSGHELVYDEFQREGRLEHLDRWPSLTIKTIPGRSDLHTMRPIWLQRRVHEILDAQLATVLERSADRHGVPT